MAWKDGESAEDFANRITGLANNLRVLSNDMKDVEIVCKMLQVVPENLAQVAISIETLLDLNDLSIEEITGRLRAVEQWRQAPPVTDNQGRLLLCEEEWMARLKLRDSEEKGSGSGTIGGSGSTTGASGKKRSSRGRGRGHGKSDASTF
ncbi:uncharacterized protein [Miscanthus floridulus]|uniref:uncharacterized protein n=1 Tax=Miscanthus floridulus TaxID=154761 RepID=UPI00345AF6A4